MGQVRVIIQDQTHSKKTTVELPDDVPMARLTPALAARMGLPLAQANGSVITWRLDHRRTGRRLDDEQTLADVDINPDDLLTLLPEVTAGGPGEPPLSRSEEVSALGEIITNFVAFRPAGHADGAEIDKKLHSLLTRVADENAKRYTDLVAEIRREAALQATIREINAPVEVPTPEQMKVKLVPAHLLTWLEETRAEEARWGSVGWAFIGAFLGVIINWVTTDTIHFSRPAVIILVTFGIVAILAFSASYRYGKRAQAVRVTIMNRGTEATSSPSLQP